MKTNTFFKSLTIVLLLLTVCGFAQSIPTADRTIPVAGFSTAGEKRFISLNGLTDYAESIPLLSGLEKATLMGWVKIGNGLNTNAFLFGQEVFQVKVIPNGSNVKLMAATQTQSVTYSENLVPNRWYHITAVFDNTMPIRIYINGKYDALATASGPSSNSLGISSQRFTMGKNPAAMNEFFKGALDEIRVFNTALPESAIQKMIYQEIRKNGTAISGEVIPKDIETVTWNNLIAYYRLDDLKDVISGNLITAHLTEPNTDDNIQSAPMPFVTKANGTLAQALGNEANDALAHSWSIILVKHNVSLSSNMIALGMIVDANCTVSLSNDIKLQNSWYLKLDGKIDLKGKSQLVQTIDSELDPSSAGFIEREQQGQSNLFNYNYWCSPVGSINATTNNNSYTVNGILRDATNPNQLQNINWTTALNGAPTAPVTLSGFWIFKFQNQTPVYANWSSVGPNGTFLPGQGFTLKGCGSDQPVQNLAFVGKPNNGTITSPIAAGNLNLTGNPYPSALDADAFIKANSSVINGTIYFWEHFASNTSHQLADYQGGYATKNLVGGTPPVSPAAVSDLGDSDRMPHRFIPVGQGFFVQANSVGGTIVFNNSQRAFVKENASGSNVIFRQSNPVTDQESNQNDAYEEDTFARVRLGFNADNFHRQVLLGFMNENASSAFEAGYDAHNIDTQPSDMYLMNMNYKLVIEGEGYFNENNIYPIGVKTASANPVQIVLDGTENFDQDQPIYIYDNLTLQYHDMRSGAFTISLPAGTYLNRFSLRFKTDSSLGNVAFNNANSLDVTFTNADDTIVIQNDRANVSVESASLFNLLGQSVATWNITQTNQHKIQIPIGSISSGAYVVKVHTTDGDLTKKIVIR